MSLIFSIKIYSTLACSLEYPSIPARSWMVGRVI